MATFTLQTLELRAALVTGASQTGQGSKGTCLAMRGNPAQVLSLPWQPLPGHAVRTVPEPLEGYRDYSMDTLEIRAGRSVGSAGIAGRVIARLAGRTILSTWSATPPFAKTRRRMIAAG